MDSGFITLHRKITEWEWYTDGNTMRLFIHLLLKANHEDKKWRGVDVKRGQLITGRKALAKELKLSEQQIRTSMNKLKSTNEITIKPTNKFTVVTLVNYSVYQSSKKQKQPTKQPMNDPTGNQQVTTNNNDNNNNNIYTIRMAFPGKKTKKVADAKLPKLIEKYGYEQILNTVERYKKDVEQQRINGFKGLNFVNEGTFWNGRYIDYLDENYEAAKPSAQAYVKPTKGKQVVL